MAHSVLVNVLNTGDQLHVQLASLLFRESLTINNEIEELTTWAVFHNQEKLLVGFDDLIKHDYILVLHNIKNLDLPAYSVNITLALDPVLLKNFDGYFLFGDQVLTKHDLSEGALS